MIRGIVTTGRGEAAGFTRLAWVAEHVTDWFGIDPHPGTLNLRIADAAGRDAWRALRARASATLVPPSDAWCRADWHAVRIGGIAAAAVVPAIPGYPDDTIELIAAVALREHAGLRDGDVVTLEPFLPMAPRAVLFDVDGTLVDSVPAYIEIARAAGATVGVAIDEMDVRRALAYGERFWERAIAPDRADRGALMDRLMVHARANWPQTMRTHCRPIAGLDAALAELRRQGRRLGIVTGARPEVIDIVRQSGVAQPFEAIVGNTDVKRRKPDPEGILLALERMGVAPADAIYVGDSPIDVEAAHRAGLRAVGVLTGAGDSAMLSRAGADRLIGSVARLPGVLAASQP